MKNYKDIHERDKVFTVEILTSNDKLPCSKTVPIHDSTTVKLDFLNRDTRIQRNQAIQKGDAI